MSSFPSGTKTKKLTAIMTDNSANTLVVFFTKLSELLKLKRSVFNSKYSKIIYLRHFSEFIKHLKTNIV